MPEDQPYVPPVRAIPLTTVRPVLLVNLSSSDDMFSGKLAERTERISYLLLLQYTTKSCLSKYPPRLLARPRFLWSRHLEINGGAPVYYFSIYSSMDPPSFP